MELYLPVNQYFRVSFKSYSKKPRHLVSYDTSIQYVGAHNSNAKLPNGKDHVWFNSDRVDLSINVAP